MDFLVLCMRREVPSRLLGKSGRWKIGNDLSQPVFIDRTKLFH